MLLCAFAFVLTFAFGQEILSANISAWTSLDCPGTADALRTVDVNVCTRVLESPLIYGTVNCNVETTSPPQVDQFTFVNDIWPLLQDNAFAGHASGGMGSSYLYLTNSPLQSYNTLTQEFSKELPTMKYITSYQPSTSYLYHKITNTQNSVGGTGSVMPPGGIMSAEILNVFHQWILQGAIYNTTPTQSSLYGWKILLFSDSNCITPMSSYSIDGENEMSCVNVDFVVRRLSLKVQCYNRTIITTESPTITQQQQEGSSSTNTSSDSPTTQQPDSSTQQPTQTSSPLTDPTSSPTSSPTPSPTLQQNAAVSIAYPFLSLLLLLVTLVWVNL